MLLKNKIPKYIIDDIEISSDSDEENSDEEIMIEKIQMMKNSDEEGYSDESSGKNYFQGFRFLKNQKFF